MFDRGLKHVSEVSVELGKVKQNCQQNTCLESFKTFLRWNAKLSSYLVKTSTFPVSSYSKEILSKIFRGKN